MPLTTPALQALTMQTKNQTLLKKGKPYSKQLMSSELDRLVELSETTVTTSSQKKIWW